MNKHRFLLMAISLLFILAACSNKEDSKKEDTLSAENLEQKIAEEEKVIESDIQEENDKVILTIKIDEGTTEKEAESIANKYLNELVAEKKDKQIEVNLIKGEKQIVSKTSNQNESTTKANSSSEKVDGLNNLKVKALVAEKKVTLKENVITQQLSVLIDKRVMLELKDDAAVELLIGEEKYTFEVNQFESAILQVNNTDYTEAELLEAEIVIK